MTRFLTSLLLSLWFVPICPAQTSPTEPLKVSIIQLLATPERFEGKSVVVSGFLRIQQEADLLYLSKEDYDNVILSNALWIDVSRDMLKDREKIDLNYVRIVGTFRTGHEKRNDFSVGGIVDIRSCRFLSDPANPLENKIKALHQ